MIEMTSDHSALLKAIARNTNDKPAIKAYSDWLQENGSEGWLIAANYKLTDWPVVDRFASEYRWERNYTHYRLCWLNGRVQWKRFSHPLQRMKYILNAYADGDIEQ